MSNIIALFSLLDVVYCFDSLAVMRKKEERKRRILQRKQGGKEERNHNQAVEVEVMVVE